ncbi:MAG: S-layer homology domain-containing protein [Armatimonadetes bacterium]|nr:S-layer homology domain-containing protein [Armatimonadota bacterium]
MRNSLSLAVFFLIFSFLFLCPGLWAVPFPDVPGTHWAQEAVNQLAAKGLLEGYPSSDFRGDRAASRYELAMLVARVVAKVESLPAPDLSSLATKADLDAIQALLAEYRKELDALGVRVDNVESKIESLTTRVEELERVRPYGAFEVRGISAGFQGPAVSNNQANPAVNLPAYDLVTGRPTPNGSVVSTKGLLGVSARLGKDLTAGTELAAFSMVGSNPVGYYWGVTPPYFSNPFNDYLAGSNLKAFLERFWIQHDPSKTVGVAGAYYPRFTESFAFYGPPNPTAYGPETLPLFGGSLSGKVKLWTLPTSNFELMSGKLPEASPYGTLVPLSAYLDGEIFGGTIRLNYLRVLNEPGNLPTGLVTIPVGTAPVSGLSTGAVGINWVIPGTATAQPIGPQSENVYGLSASFKLPFEITGTGEIAQSQYWPTGVGANVAGSLGRVQLERVFKGNFETRASLEYLTVSPTYDPFVLEISNIDTVTGVWPAPLSTHYSRGYFRGFYQVHDSIKYPDNRQGFRTRVDFTSKKGNTLGLFYDGLTQQSSSTPGNLAGLGFTEVYFPQLTGGEDSKGQIRYYGGNFGWSPLERLTVSGAYQIYRLERPSAMAANNIVLDSQVLQLLATHRASPKVSFFGGYTAVDVRGAWATLGENVNLRQNIPLVGIAYDLTSKSAVSLTARQYNQTDSTATNWNFTGQQVTAEYRLTF